MAGSTAAMEQVLARRAAEAPLEVVARTLQGYLYEASDFEAALAALQSTARRSPAAARRMLEALRRLLQQSLPAGTLAMLVARDANWVLADPSDAGAAGLLRRLAEDLERMVEPFNHPMPSGEEVPPGAPDALGVGTGLDVTRSSRPENFSSRWLDEVTMNEAVQHHVRDHWSAIRAELALGDRYVATFDAGRIVGEGFYNEGLAGRGPTHARFVRSSQVRLILEFDPDVLPDRPIVISAFPYLPLPEHAPHPKSVSEDSRE